MRTHALIPAYACMLIAEDKLSRSCPYLDTIDRSVLDFDFEKLCSVSLLNNNVYACLVCGKYFQGELARALSVTDVQLQYVHVLSCRSWSALACLHSQCTGRASCLAQLGNTQLLLSPRQLPDH